MILSETIKECIKKNIPFAFIRLPKEKKIYLIKKEKKGLYNYSFHSFDNLKKYTFQFSEFIEIKDITTLYDLLIPLSKNENTRVISENEYLNLLQKTIHYIYQKQTDKIVISREKWLERDIINPIRSFGFLCKQYSASFCHVSYWNQNEIWIGVTPEILGSYDNCLFTTMALAGTLPDMDTIQWGNKEIKEQKYVTDYICEKIKPYASKFTIYGPETLHLGHVKHLATYLSAELKNANLLPELIASLHPTPAVCGIPLDMSRNYILNNEGYNRGFYAGYIGLETTEYKKYFVNLRCAQLYNNGALLYVGGGITAQSIPKKEWIETELKAKFIGESL